MTMSHAPTVGIRTLLSDAYNVVDQLPSDQVWVQDLRDVDWQFDCERVAAENLPEIARALIAALEDAATRLDTAG